jgi:hypothetical protein
MFDHQVPQQGGDVVRHLLVGERAVYVGSVPVPLQLDGDDLPSLGEGRHNLSYSVDRHVRAVKQDQRLSRAVDLVVYVEAVHLSIVAFRGIVHPVSFLATRSCLLDPGHGRLVPASRPLLAPGDGVAVVA